VASITFWDADAHIYARRDASRCIVRKKTQELNESVTARFFLRQRVSRARSEPFLFGATPPRGESLFIFVFHAVKWRWEKRTRERRYGKGGEKGCERTGESRREEDASASAARSSNYYGFSGSNSPDGNTTQFTHADCAREDVNSLSVGRSISSPLFRQSS